jgi:hypothetical protein
MRVNWDRELSKFNRQNKSMSIEKKSFKFITGNLNKLGYDKNSNRSNG